MSVVYSDLTCYCMRNQSSLVIIFSRSFIMLFMVAYVFSSYSFVCRRSTMVTDTRLSLFSIMDCALTNYSHRTCTLVSIFWKLLKKKSIWVILLSMVATCSRTRRSAFMVMRSMELRRLRNSVSSRTTSTTSYFS